MEAYFKQKYVASIHSIGRRVYRENEKKQKSPQHKSWKK